VSGLILILRQMLPVLLGRLGKIPDPRNPKKLKHQGYSYEHAFAKQWNAMKGYHYLMRLAHLLNTLARFSKELAELFSAFGVQAAIGFIRNTLTGPWLDPQEIASA